MGHLALPQHTPLQEQKVAKISKFLAFHIFPPPPIHNPPPHPQQKITWCSHWKENFQSGFKACENIQWCKNTCYLEVGFKA